MGERGGGFAEDLYCACAARVISIRGSFLPRLLSTVIVVAFCVVAALASVSSISSAMPRPVDRQPGIFVGGGGPPHPLTKGG